MIRFLILFSFLINHFSISLHVFSGALVLFTYILTPSQDKLFAKATKCIFLGYSRLQCGYRCYSPDTYRYFISADVTLFEQPSIFSTPPPSSPEVLSLPLILPIPALPSESLTTLMRPLQVYTHRPQPDTKPPIDSSPMVPSFTIPVLPSPTALPIPIRKDTRSSRNPHSIYNFLTYHPLSLPFSAFMSTLSFVSLSQTTH